MPFKYPAYLEAELFQANENVDRWEGPQGSITNKKAPDIQEINTLINTVLVMPFPDTTFPHATASETSGVPLVNQNANVKRRATGNYEGGGSVMFPIEPFTDTQNMQVAYANLLRQTAGKIVSVTRISQSPEKDRQPAKEGDIVSVFDFMSTYPIVPQPGGDEYRIDTSFMTDGYAGIDLIAIDGPVPTEPVVISAAGAASSLKVGQPLSLFARLYGHNITYVGDWRVSAGQAFASVSNAGVLTGIAPGAVTVECSHDSGVAATIVLTVAAATAPTSADITDAVAGAVGVYTTTGWDDASSIERIVLDGDEVGWYGATDDGNLAIQFPDKAAGTYDLLLYVYGVNTPTTVQVTFV